MLTPVFGMKIARCHQAYGDEQELSALPLMPLQVCSSINMDKCLCRHDTFQTRNWLRAFCKVEKKKGDGILHFFLFFPFIASLVFKYIQLPLCFCQSVQSKSILLVNSFWNSHVCFLIALYQEQKVVNSLVHCFLLAVSTSEKMPQSVITVFSVGGFMQHNNRRVKIVFLPI